MTDSTPERCTAELWANTSIPALAPELCRLMLELAASQGFSAPRELTCEVRMVFKDKVTKDGVRRLLQATDRGLWGLNARCCKDDADHE